MMSVKKTILNLIILLLAGLLAKSQQVNSLNGVQSSVNNEYSIIDSKTDTSNLRSNKVDEIHLQESENYASQCDIGEETLPNGFIRKNVLVKREISKEEIEDLKTQGKVYSLDETGKYLQEYTSIDMLPEDWIFSADGDAAAKRMDSYGNPIINEVDGLPGFAQRDIDILKNDLKTIYRYYSNFQFALNGQLGMINVFPEDDFKMDSYTNSEDVQLGNYLLEYETQLANLISQVIIRKIEYSEMIDLSSLPFAVVEKLSVELNNYEKEKYTQSCYKSFGDFNYTKTIYSDEIISYFGTYGIDLARLINNTYLTNINTNLELNTRATPSSLYYRGSGSYSSLTSGTNLCAGGTSTTYDDNIYSVSMPFLFEYYECQNATSVSTIYVSVNGGVNVSANSFYYNRSSLPQSGYNSYICPACDDWSCYGKDTYGSNANDKVFYNVQGAVGSRVMSVNWYSITNYGTSNPENTYAYFSTKIYEVDNSIDVSINYLHRSGEEISYLNGIENRSGTDADCGESCTLIYPPDNTDTYKADYRFYPNVAKSVSLSVSDNSICSGTSTTLTAGTPTGYCNGGSWQYQFETTGGSVVRGWSTTNNCSVSPTSTTSYVVKARCSLTTCKIATSSSVSVVVSTPPTTPTGISGTTNICTGSSTTLTATGGTSGSGCTYQWYAGGCGSGSVLGTGSSITVSPSSNTTYYVRRVGTSNCTNTTGCASVTVSVDAQSNAGTMSITNSQMCSGGGTTFSVSGTTGFQQMQYQWNGTGGTWNNWGSSNPHAWSSTSTGSTLYVRSWADNGACASVYSSPVSVSIVADPVAPTITRTPNSSPVCQGTSLDINVAGGAGGCGTITNQYRYNNGSWSSWSTSTPAFTATPGTNYYESRRIATGNGCNDSPSNQVSWTVDTNPTAGTVSTSTTSACPGDGVTFDAVGYSGTFETFEYKWNAGGTTNDWVDTDPYTWTAGNSGNSLYVRSRIGNGVCSDVYSPWSSGVVVNAESTAPTGVSITNNNTCNGTSKTLSVTGGGLGTGATWHWYTGSCGGTSAGTGNSITVNPAAGSSTTYYVRAEGACNTTGCASGTVVVSSLSTSPTGVSITNNNTCNGISKTLIVTGGSLGTGAIWHWYTGSCGGTSAGTGNSITVNPAAGSSTTYYVRAEGTCNTTGCASGVVVVSSLSTSSTGVSITNNNTCNGTSKTLTVTGGSLGTGATWHWYTGSCGGTSAGTGNSITVNPAAGSSTTYYVRAEGACNTTGCASGTVVVSSLSTSPTGVSITNNNTCNGISKTLSVSGGSLGTGATWHWYTGSCGGTSVGTGNSITVNPAAGSSTTYYVRAEGACNTTGCANGTVVVSSLSTSPTGVSIANNNTCNGTSKTLIVTGGSLGTGATWHWYTGSCGGTSAGTGSSITVNPTAGSSTTYYVRAEGACNTTGCANGTVVVSSLSTAPTGVSIANNNTCNGTSKTLTVTGGSLGTGATWHWYTGSCGGTSAGTGSSITVNPAAGSSTTYYVRAEGACNTTGCANGTVVVSSLSTSPTGVSITNNNTCNGTSKTLTVTGGSLGTGATWHWYTGSCGGTSAGTGNSITVNPAAGSSTTYYVRAEGACNTTGCASGTVVVTSNASIASVTGVSLLCIGGTDTYSANSVVLGGGSGAWSSSNAAIATVNSSGVVTAVSAGTCNIIYTITGGCNGTPLAQQSLTVNPNLPVSVLITASENPTCAGVEGTFTATPTNGGIPSYQWKLNGANVGINSNIYANSGLLDGDQVSCVLTSTVTCATGSPATSNVIAMSVNTPATTGLTNGDYVWSGNTSNDWGTASNWLIYDGLDFSAAGVIPDNSNNVFMRTYASCASNAAVTSVSSSVSCHDITIETGLTMGNLSSLSVTGDWINNGAFIAGEGSVVFNGSTAQSIDAGGDSFKNITFSNTSAGNNDVEIVSPLNIDGTATFTNGIVCFSGTGSMNFSTIGFTSGGSVNSFVDGVVSRSGSGIFKMPTGDVVTRDIGDGNLTYAVWGPLQINHASLANTTVEYNYSNSGMPDWWEHGGNMDATLHHVSSREHWIVNSDENMSNISLYWNDNAHANSSPCIHGLCNGDNIFTSSDLTVAYWSGTVWRNAGGTVSGAHDSGSVTSTLQVPFGAKSQKIVTFGSKRNDNPLPVELSFFVADCEGEHSRIKWQTLSEINNDYFILEKSNGKDVFYEVARLKGAGNSNKIENYEYSDESLFDGDNYYRLLQVDYDGKVTVHEVIVLNCEDLFVEEPVMNAYPNPFNDELNIVVEGLEDAEFVLEIFDDLGRIVYSKKCTSEFGEFKTVIDLEGLRPAVYHLRSKSDKHVINMKVIKK